MMHAGVSGTFNYLPATPVVPDDRQRRLAAAAAVEPILRRWRDHCPAGLIDETGKIRNVFTRQGADDTAGRVIAALNGLPAAEAEFAAALAARQELEALNYNAVCMPVHNARNLADAALDTSGFELRQHVSAVSNWQDTKAIRAIYYPEVEALVKQVTGASHVFSNNHLLRQSEPATGGNGPLAKLLAQSRGAVRNVHNDFAENYADGIIKTIAAGGTPHTQTFGLTEPMLAAGITADQLRGYRMVIINTWRSLDPAPLQRWPLALADRRSIPRASLRATLIGKKPCGQPRGGIEIYKAWHDPAHTWYYYPDMTRDELLLFKGFDSADKPARPPLHSSFAYPGMPDDAPERRSIEVRALCLIPH